MLLVSRSYTKEKERGGVRRRGRIIFPFCLSEHKATNTTTTPDVISSDPVFCLF